MPEISSAELAALLKKDGRWDEFKAFRQAAESRGNSKKQSYTMAAKQFGYDLGTSSPPTSNPPPAEGVPELPSRYAKKEEFGGEGSSLKQDYQWVYDNLAVEDVTPAEAPSSGAWGLLQFARTDPKSFYVEWMRMVSRQESSDEVMEGFVQDATRSTDEIAAMVRLLRDAAGLGSPEDSGGEPAVPADDPPKKRERQGSTA
jgi:hypothetical protein